MDRCRLNHDQWAAGEWHTLVLWIFPTQEGDSSGVGVAGRGDARLSVHVNPRELLPILAVGVDDDGNTRIGANVADALELGVATRFGLASSGVKRAMPSKA